MSTDFKPARRIVTGINSHGRSYIQSDGPTPNFGKSPAGEMYIQVPWVTGDAVVSEEEPAPAGHHFGFHSENGTVLRIIDYPPETLFDGESMRKFLQLHGVADPGEPRHYGFHKTETVDYAVILSGEIYALLDEDETLMKTGDVLIQRGTNHSWANRSSHHCKILFVLVSEKTSA